MLQSSLANTNRQRTLKVSGGHSTVGGMLTIRARIFCLGACSSLLYLNGCAAISSMKTVQETRNTSEPHVAQKPISIQTSNGSISVKQGNVQDVEITATVKARSEERLAQTEIIAKRNSADVLEISVAWPEKRKVNEGCSFEVILPDVDGIKARSSNGRITLANLSGKVDAKTSNGRIKIEKHFGPVVADTSNGRIEATDIAGSLDADTSNGKVVVKRVAGALKIETSNGSVDAELLPGNNEPFEIRSSNGGVKMTIGAEFAGTISMKTSNGSIDARVRKADLLKTKKREQTIRLGDSEALSKIRTSNSSITLKQLSKETVDVQAEVEVVN